MILDLIVENLNLSAELPYLRPRSQALYLPSVTGHLLEVGVRYRCDGGDGGDPCDGAPPVIKDMMLPNNCQCSINPVYQVEEKITCTSF